MTVSSKPANIVYIVLDDMGYSDLGCYGSEIHTPHIDRLAAGGLRYTNFNVTPLCSPTRACLLTGRNNNAVGMGSIASHDLGSDSHIHARITPAAATLAEILRDSGYSTYAAGKWHLAPTHHITPIGPYDYWPLGKGFERYYGFLEGFTDQYTPDLVCDNHMIETPVRPRYHLSEDLVDQSIQFLTDKKSVVPEKPFFLYLAFGAQHAPHQVHPEYIDRYEHVYDQGWDHIREQRFIRQKQLGIVPADAELAPRNPGVKPWDSLTEEEKRIFARFMETYAGFLTHTDEQIGRLIKHLEACGLFENTMIVLISDNGACVGGAQGTTNYVKYYNDIVETAEEQSARIAEFGGPNSLLSYPAGWAQASNTPFKYYKRNVHFGGVRVPLIVHWPSGVRDTGAVRRQFHHAIDVTPTVLDILGIRPPDMYRGVAQMPMHGTSMRYSFDRAEAPTTRTTQYFSMYGHRAIWHRGWKAAIYHHKGKPFDQDKWELYHVDEDMAEVHDLAERYPEKLRELQDLWWAEAGKYHALPLLDKDSDMVAYKSPESVSARNHFTYLPGMTKLGSSASPPIVNRSYAIAIPVERQHASDDGVLVAFGNSHSGYTLYISGNRLVYEYNHVGAVYRLVSNREVPLGPSTLGYVFRKSGHLSGIGTLFIDSVHVGELDIPVTLSKWLAGFYLTVGRDGNSQVSAHYPVKGSFPFAGVIRKVMFDVEEVQP